MNTFRTQDNSSKSKNHSSRPAIKLEQKPDEFVSSVSTVSTTSVGLLGKFLGKIKDVAINSTNHETREKINKARLTKLFIENGSLSISDISEYSDLLNSLAKQDYNKVQKKYKAIIGNIKDEVKSKNSYQYKADIKL